MGKEGFLRDVVKALAASACQPDAGRETILAGGLLRIGAVGLGEDYLRTVPHRGRLCGDWSGQEGHQKK